MTLYDLILRGGDVVTETGTQLADLAVAEGHIVAIEPAIEGTAAREIDAAGLRVLPGAIDAHVHFNEPGRANWEGWATGTSALAAGGATTGIEMPLNALPPTIDGPAFDVKRTAAEAAARVDFALWGGLVPGNVEHLADLAGRGVVGFKAFMSDTGTPEFEAADDATLYAGMIEAARLGRPVAVHAENRAITASLAAEAIAGGRTGARDYLASRPIVAEVEAIGRAICFAEETGCALHVVHVSTGRGVALVAAARARGVDVTCETCPHYLIWTEDDLETLGAVAKCAPPLRPAAERAALWAAIETGDLDFVASDHSPAPADLKAGDDWFAIWGGIAGCQSLLPSLLSDGYHAQGVGLPAIARLTSGAVARRFGLASKGRLAVGADADLALVDLGAESTLRGEDLHYRHQLSPFVDRTFQGRVVRTIVRGQTVCQEGTIVGEPIGHLIRPERTGGRGDGRPQSHGM